MIRPKAGLLVFSESLAREDVYQKRKAVCDREVDKLITALASEVELVRPGIGEIRGKKQAFQALRGLEAEGVDAVILYVGIFVVPAVVAHTANLINVPKVLACNEAPDSISQLAFLAVSGAMRQIGVECFRVPGDASEEPNRSLLLQFLRAAAVKQKLRGQTFGCIGGRSLGIITATAELSLWEKIFGVDIEHIDQYEIVKRAEKQSEQTVDKHIKWISKNAGAIHFNESNFTPRHFENQIRSYLATKEIIEDYELDFIGVKCQTEMSNRFCLQCLNVSFCNDPYDADGPKEPVCCSCEADADGALTMQILKILSDRPTCLNDLVEVSKNKITLANCGAMATHFTRLSEKSEDNMAGLTIGPHNFGQAGGGSTQFVVPSGKEMTFARLFHQPDKYILGVLTGTTISEKVPDSSPLRVRPLIFARINIDKKYFLQTFGSNHILAVEGNLKPELKLLAPLLGIEYIDYDCVNA